MSGVHVVRRKWRPSIGLVLVLVLTTVSALPLVGLFFFRIYENQLIRQTETELIGQAAVLAAELRRDIETSFPADVPLGRAIAPVDGDSSEPLAAIVPTLDLASDELLPRPPEPEAAAEPADPAFVALGKRITPDLVETQRLTLAGFRILDPHGVVIAGHNDIGLSLSAIEEVTDALRGERRSVMRLREPVREPPPIYSLSRGTSLRIFLAMPVIARGHVAAVVYASRTPSNIFSSLHAERRKLAVAGLAVIAITVAIGFVFHRAIPAPMRELIERTDAIGRGDDAAFSPIRHSGTRELASLAVSLFDMAEKLRSRSEFISTFAAHVSHELKSPLTSIQGAAELLRDDAEAGAVPMSDGERRRFAEIILADSRRLAEIVQRLRALAQAENAPTGGVTAIAEIIDDLRSTVPGLKINADGDVSAKIRISSENLGIVLGHLADNSEKHGASELNLHAVRAKGRLTILVRDNGSGISASNRSRIFDKFFTTRRDSGGTGMGLSIAEAVVAAHGGTIALFDEAEAPRGGAAFRIELPLAADGAGA